MAVTSYNGSDANTICHNGGSVRVTIASNAGQGNGGTSLACKGCYINSNGQDVRVKIGSACTDSTGIAVPWYGHSTTTNETYSVWNALFLPIDDISQLYFYGGTNGVVVDILYFTS